MFIVIAWALVIWLVMLLAFGPDLFKVISGPRTAARDKTLAQGEDREDPTHGAVRDTVAR